MDAAADYTDVRRALANANLPAYVSYVVRSRAGFDAVQADDTTTIVVRTRDGKVVAGKPPKINIESGGDAYGNDVVQHGPFKPECYAAKSATLTTFEAQPVEAIALEALCHEKHVGEHSGDADFSILYADPATHRPIAVLGQNDEQFVTARLDERFAVTGGFVMPTRFTVKIVGSGPMFWLNVDAAQSYSNYRFLSQAPD
jgi:hypothetical protein